MEFTKDFLNLAEDHVRAFQVMAAIASIISVTVGIGIGWLLKLQHARRIRREYRKMENPGVVVFEAHVLRDRSDGGIELDVVSWGGKHTLTQLLHDPILEQKLEDVVRKQEGFLSLPAPGQLMVMDGFEETITGNDSSANLDYLRGRSSRVDEVIMCPITWPGRRAAHLIRVVIIDPVWMELLCDPNFVRRIKAVRPRYEYRADWLHRIAMGWRLEKDKSEEEACMRQVKITSQRL